MEGGGYPVWTFITRCRGSHGSTRNVALTMTTNTYRRSAATDNSSRNRWTKTALTAGFLALTWALVAAITAPASGYELSIYRATPSAFWIGVGVALLAASLVMLGRGSVGTLRLPALALAGGAVLSVLALPILRGYYFYGQGDSLSHLGFALSFETGAASPLELLHPGVHLASAVVDNATGGELQWAMLLTVLAFFALFFVFVPLCVRQVTGDNAGLTVGLFVALLLLPINAIGTHVVTHPSSQAIMFTPFVLYLLFAYLRQPADGWFRPTPIGILLSLGSAAVLVVHPQETMNLLVILGTVAVLQFVARRYRPNHPFATQRSVYFQTLLLGALWFLWAPRSERVTGRLERALSFLSGTSGGSATPAAGRSASIAAIGGSLEELFVKLFLAALVFSIIAGVVMLATATGRLDDAFPDNNALIKYLTAAFVPLSVGTAVVFLGSFGDHYFRFVAFLMVLVTIVAAAAIARAGSSGTRFDATTVRRATLVLFVLLLPLAITSMHPSPWIYQGTPQVTTEGVAGYEAAFEQAPEDAVYAGVRGGGERYAHAIYGPFSERATTFSEEAIPPAAFGTNLAEYYDDARYIPIQQSDVEREADLYRGLRYDREGFQRLETTPGVNRVQSTDEFRLYFVRDE